MAKRIPVPRLSPDERKKDFKEITSVVRPQAAVGEANRCILCNDPPCNQGCPAGVDVKGFIRALRSQNFRSGIRIIREKNILGGVCARVCPQEALCEKSCSSSDLAEPIAIGELQRFLMDTEVKQGFKSLPVEPSNGKKVAVIGAGPSGLAAASRLACRGYEVVIFEKEERPGGLLRYGIPPYRLPREILDGEIELVARHGVSIQTGIRVESPGTLLGNGFEAVFLATGLQKDQHLPIPGRETEGILTWRDFLREAYEKLLEGNRSLQYAGKKVAVIGGGNVALDCASVALRLGAEVSILYRRSRSEMPAWEEEIADAEEVGVSFVFLCQPKRFVAENGRLSAVECLKTSLGEPDASGRLSFRALEGSEFQVPSDFAIEALGQVPDGLFSEIRQDGTGHILADENGMTSARGIFAGGDLVNGGKTVVQAVADGCRAAEGIDQFLGGGRVIL
ncbi:MAG: NAD(P)-dependent oxidoreductase [bacterium]